MKSLKVSRVPNTTQYTSIKCKIETKANEDEYWSVFLHSEGETFIGPNKKTIFSGETVHLDRIQMENRPKYIYIYIEWMVSIRLCALYK